MGSHRYISILDAACSEGDGVANEDALAWLPHAAWVLDGVSGLEPTSVGGETAPRWFAQSFSTALAQGLLEQPGAATLALINQALEQCQARWNAFDLADTSSPAATFAMIRLLGDMIELTAIGDCAIRYRAADGHVRVFTDRSVEAFEDRSLDQLRRLQSENPGTPHAELARRMTPQLAQNRRHLNKPDGYNALTLLPILPRNLVSKTLRVDVASPFLLTTDGFSRYSEVLELGTDEALYEAARMHRLDETLQSIRNAERSDPECRRYLRMKRSDDATALKVKVQAF